MSVQGFSLWLAENKSQFEGSPEEVQDAALLKWKSLGKEEKEQYKAPRWVTSACSTTTVHKSA